MTLFWVAQGVPDVLDVAVPLSWGNSKSFLLHEMKTECNHAADLVECWHVLGCVANWEEKEWLSRQVGTTHT